MNAKLLNRFNWGRTSERMEEQQDVKVKCEFCNEEYDYKHGFGKCKNNCEPAPIIFTESDMIKYFRENAI